MAQKQRKRALEIMLENSTQARLGKRKAHPLCERCLKKGIYTRSTCVHHKVHIDQDNYRDIHILFGDSNLEALCDLCHAEEHSKRKPSFEFDENGMLIGCGREDDECKKEHGKKE